MRLKHLISSKQTFAINDIRIQTYHRSLVLFANTFTVTLLHLSNTILRTRLAADRIGLLINLLIEVIDIADNKYLNLAEAKLYSYIEQFSCALSLLHCS